MFILGLPSYWRPWQVLINLVLNIALSGIDHKITNNLDDTVTDFWNSGGSQEKKRVLNSEFVRTFWEFLWIYLFIPFI